MCVSTKANSQLRLWKRMVRLLLLLLVVCGRLKSALAFRSIHAAFAGSPPLLLDRCHHVADCRRRSRGRRTQLCVDFDEDEYSRLIRRIDHLERIVSEQSTELEVMRSSMDEMRMIIQIQAQLDSLLVEDGEEGLLAARAEVGTNGEPDPRLVKQALTLLRMRQRVLQAWEYEDADLEIEQPDEDDHTGESLASEFSAMRGLRGLSRSPPQDQSSRPRKEEGRPRDSRLKDSEELTYSMFDNPLDSPITDAVVGRGGRSGEEDEVEEDLMGYGFGSRLAKRPPKTNQDAADAAGASVVAALMEGRRRLIVEVDDGQLRFNSPDFCHEAMAEFVELLVLPLTTALENLNAKQNRCKIVIQGAHHVAQAKQAMVLDAPDSLQVVSLEDAKVAKKDRVVALVSPENWTGKKGKHLKRILAEAHDAAIILINPTDPDKFLQPEDFNNFEFVYHLRPMRINYLQPVSPSQQPPARSRVIGGEALLLESLGDSVRAEEEALTAAAAAEEEAAARELISDMDDADASVELETPEAEIGLQAAERALSRAALELWEGMTRDKYWGQMDIGYRDRERDDREDERLSNEAATAATAWEMAEQAEGMGERWGEGEVGGCYGTDEAAEMSALAVTLRQYPEAWEAFVDLHDGMGFRLCGTWDLKPPRAAVRTVVMDHILRIVMD